MSTPEERLAEVIAGHCLANTSRERYCICGAFLGDWAGMQEVTAHQAAVVLAHLTAEGWAQGEWEYGVTFPTIGTHPQASREAAEEMVRRDPRRSLKRRIVGPDGDWEQV